MKQVLAEVVGASVLEKYCQRYPEDFAEICKELYVALMTSPFGVKCTITIPCSLQQIFSRKSDGDTQGTFDISKFSSQMYWKRDKLCFSKELFHSFFDVPCSAIKSLVNNLQQKPESKGTENIIMIGAFAELPTLQTKIKQALPTMNFIIPPDAGHVSLMGAVLYGHEHIIQPKYPSSRVDKFIKKFKNIPVVLD